MTSATTEPARRTHGHRVEGHGLIVFASVLLVIIGCFNLIYGIAAIAHSHVLVANAHYVIGNLRTWGWITLIIGALQLLAAAGVVTGNQLARWLAVEHQGELVGSPHASVLAVPVGKPANQLGAVPASQRTATWTITRRVSPSATRSPCVAGLQILVALVRRAGWLGGVPVTARSAGGQGQAGASHRGRR